MPRRAALPRFGHGAWPRRCLDCAMAQYIARTALHLARAAVIVLAGVAFTAAAKSSFMAAPQPKDDPTGVLIGELVFQAIAQGFTPVIKITGEKNGGSSRYF